ncbi:MULTISPECIES: CotH kinase family protein [Paenibacillus]|nr:MULTISPECIES: CotH kinase family protein [Paenibacillus]
MRAGIPERSVLMGPDQRSELDRDIWSRRYVPAKLGIGGRISGARIRYRGGHTREYAKKSYEIQLESGLVLHWNAESDDPSMIRNALSFHFMEQIGVPSPRTRPVWLSVSGRPDGIYLEIEAVNSRFFSMRGIRYRSLLYAANDSANFELKDPESRRRKRSLADGYEFIEGDGDTLVRLSDFIGGLHRLKDSRLQEAIEERLDLDLYFKWLAGAVLTGNYDGFEQNYALYEDDASGRYGILPWDYEGSWGRNCFGKPCSADLVRIQGYNGLTRRVFQFPEWRRRYAEELERIMETEFTEERIGPVAGGMLERIASAVKLDPARAATLKAFGGEKAFILAYIGKRRRFVRAELKRWLGNEVSLPRRQLAGGSSD